MIDTAVGKSRRLKEGILKAEWEKIVGKICEKCQPDYIKDKILYIRAESTFFIHHLTLEKAKYIKTINNYFDEEVVKDIVIRTGKLDENREEYLDKEEKEEEKAARERERRIQEAMLDIKKKYGKNAILKGLSYQEGATGKERNRQIGGHKA